MRKKFLRLRSIINYINLFNSFSYQLTAASLPFFEAYFGIPFKLPKIDMVAVPDFGFNAMEVNLFCVFDKINFNRFTMFLKTELGFDNLQRECDACT